MRNKNFGRIWVSVAIIAFVLESGGHRLIRSSLQNNALVPWLPYTTPHGWAALVLASILGGLAFTYIFLQGYTGRGAGEGLRFGLWVTLLASVPSHLALLAILPVGRRLPCEFILMDLVTFVLAGLVAAALAGAPAPAA